MTKTSEIWDNESEDRKDYIVSMFEEAFNLSKGMTEEDIKQKINETLHDDISNLDETKIDMLHYFKGETNKSNLLKGIAKKLIDINTSTVKNINYIKLNEKYEYSDTFEKNNLKIRRERYLVSGKLIVRNRDLKTGRFTK